MRRILCNVAGCGLLVMMMIAGSCSRNEYVRTMREAANDFDDGDYISAAAGFKKAMMADSTFAGYYNYALTSHAVGDDPEAIGVLDTLRQRDEGFVPPEYETDLLLNLANDVLTEAVRQKAKEAEQPQQMAAPAPEEGDEEEGLPQMAQQQAPQSVQLFQKAVQTYEEYLLREPDDLDAKERYLYARSQLPPQQEGGGGGGGQDQNQNQDQNQDQQNQDQNDQDQQEDQQNQDQNQDQQDQNDQQQDQNQQQQQQQQQQDQLNEDQIYQLLEMKEKQTRDKVDEKKARAIQLRQKDRKKW